MNIDKIRAEALKLRKERDELRNERDQLLTDIAETAVNQLDVTDLETLFNLAKCECDAYAASEGRYRSPRSGELSARLGAIMRSAFKLSLQRRNANQLKRLAEKSAKARG